MPLDEYMAHRPEHPWLAEFETDPDARFDEIVRGIALIPPYGLADAQTVLPLLFEPLDAADPLLAALDGAACRWIGRTRRIPPDERRRYGFKRYWRDVTEAFTVAQLLPLGLTRALLRDNYFDFLSWVSGQKPFGSANDPRARFWLALAKDQPDCRLQNLWLRLCRQAGAGALPDRYLTVALAGLRNLPGEVDEVLPHVVAGIAAWGAELPDTKAYRHDFVGQFQSLMWIYPKPGRSAWRPLVEPMLRSDRYQGKPFVGWWAELLSIKNLGKINPAIREPRVDEVSALVSRIKANETISVLEPEIRRLMKERRAWAETTGDCVHLYMAAGRIGDCIIERAPALTLELVEEALNWAPNNEVLWNLWGRALVNLGRRGFAEAVFWEAARRFPDNEPTLVELARLLVGCGRTEEALAVFRDAACRFPKNEPSHVELARLLAALGRTEEASHALEQAAGRFPDHGQTQVEVARLRAGLGDMPKALAGLRRYVERHPNDAIAVNILGHLLAQAGKPDEARAELERLEGMGDRKRAAELWGALKKFDADGALPLPPPSYSIEMPDEDRAAPLRPALVRDGHVTRADRQLAAAARGDLDAGIGEERRRELAGLIAAEPDHAYARLVWADHLPRDSGEAPGLLADFPRLFELRLTIALRLRDRAELDRIAADFKERGPLIRLAAVALGTADDETARAVAAWLLREPPLAEDPALRHAHGAVWAALTAARGTPRDADAIADDLPAIGDTIANVLRQTLRIATALPVAA